MSRIKSVTAFVSGLGLMFSINTFAQNSEKPVKMKNLPKAVQKTVEEQSKGAIIRGLSKEVENGKTFYEVELKINGHNKDVLIDPTGAIVEIEEEVTLGSLSQAAKAEIERQAANGKIVMVESITKNDTIVAYEAHIRTGKKYREVKVGIDGRLMTK